MKSTLERKPSEAFSSFEAFAEELKAQGFTLKLSTDSKVAANWKIIESPLSSDFDKPTEKDFCYHTKRNALPGNWGIVFRDSKMCAEPAANEIAVDFPDAAVDHLLRKMTHSEWVGDKENFIGKYVEQYKIRAEEGIVAGPGCTFAEGVILEAGVRLGARVKIGKNTRIGTGSRIADDSVIGDNCYFRGPVSIGGQGFGFIRYPKSPIPRHRVHVGSVYIADGVQFGSFVAVDRGVFEDTVVGMNSATDNFVQIGHNCKLGKHNILCGIVALAGSTILGDYVTFGGFVATKGHLKIGNQVSVGGFSAVGDDTPDGVQLRGVPARPLRQALKIMAIQDKLPEIYAQLKGMLEK